MLQMLSKTVVTNPIILQHHNILQTSRKQQEDSTYGDHPDSQAKQACISAKA